MSDTSVIPTPATPDVCSISILIDGDAVSDEFHVLSASVSTELNRIPAAFSDPREIERRMHRDYDSTQRKPNIFLLNGRSFPFTVRDTPILVKPDETTKLRILQCSGEVRTSQDARVIAFPDMVVPIGVIQLVEFAFVFQFSRKPWIVSPVRLNDDRGFRLLLS